MAKKGAICPICYSLICPLEHLMISNRLIINRLQYCVRQIGQIGQKQIGQIAFFHSQNDVTDCKYNIYNNK